MAGKKVMEVLLLRKKGFNCAQAVALPFCEELGVDRRTAMRALEGFGSGVGGAGLTCGALSGAVFIAGLKYSDGNLENPASKKTTYAVCRDAAEKFQEECGSLLCREIKGIDSGTPLKSCNECVMIAAQIAEKIVKN